MTRYDIERLAAAASKVIPQKVRHYAEVMNVRYGRITIRNPKTRWGSCSEKGNLNFNCLLMPDYKKYRKWLKDHGIEIMSRMW